ncbi:MAG: hypothetical protein JST67_06035 [Bacteroidetes bacterium]|nr:hypothetical protein [Bacteroidota bacterium]
MKKIKLILVGAAIALVSLEGCKKSQPAPAPAPAPAATNPLTTASYVALSDSMRKLWSDHMQYTYETVDAFYNDTAALSASLNRLLQNQTAIGNAIVPFYGNAAGDTLAHLLTVHIQLAVPVLTAAKQGNTSALNTALANWNANAKNIADFLSAANPNNWPKSNMESMMQMHITQTTTYAVDLLHANYSQAIADYDVAFEHMMNMSDMLCQGIALQFPNSFH